MHFFGRETLIRRLLAELAQPDGRFLAVIGPSGSGKSSVVKAGLIPALRRGTQFDSEMWYMARMVPGAHPFQELETALLSVAVGDFPALQAIPARRPMTDCCARFRAFCRMKWRNWCW